MEPGLDAQGSCCPGTAQPPHPPGISHPFKWGWMSSSSTAEAGGSGAPRRRLHQDKDTGLPYNLPSPGQASMHPAPRPSPACLGMPEVQTLLSTDPKQSPGGAPALGRYLLSAC